MSVLVLNKKALHDYTVLETLEAGIVLTGQEVKSVRAGSCNLKGSFVKMYGNELWLSNMHISPYRHASNIQSYDPERSRKLLVHKKQIKRLLGTMATQGLTLVPLRVYTKGILIKVEVALVKGKKAFEKRAILKKRAIEKDIRQYLKK